MVRLRGSGFRISGVENDHPMLVAFESKRKPHEKCWCGSGKKYKKCHRSRAEQEPLTEGQLRHEIGKRFWRTRDCLHPDASDATCKGSVIDSHSIQRKGPLAKIVDETNHVLRLEPDPVTTRFRPVRIGWHRASVFPGYCAHHDNSLFESIETAPFSGAHEECVLHAFRGVCNELYKKSALIETMEYRRSVEDRGLDPESQLQCQLFFSENLAGQRKSLEEITALRGLFNTAINTGDFSRFASRSYFFAGDLQVVSTGMLHAEFDFGGARLADMWDLSIDAELLAHGVVDTAVGGAIVFVWPTEHASSARIVDSFDEIEGSCMGDSFVQYSFLNSENTYFSQSWWDNLSTEDRQHIRKLAGAFAYDGGAFVPRTPLLVDWQILDRVSGP